MTEDLLKNTIVFLNDHGIEAKQDKNGNILFFVTISSVRYEACCCFGPDILYSIPDIIASDELFDVIKGIPHVSYNKVICTFDRRTTTPNFYSPESVVFSCITRALKIIEDGLLSKNVGDYIDEMKSYWINSAKVDKYYALGDWKEYGDYFWFLGDIVRSSKESFKEEPKKGLILKASFVFKGNYNFYYLVFECLDEAERKKLFEFIGNDITDSKMVIIHNSIGGVETRLGLFTPAYKERANGFRHGKMGI